MTPVPPRGDVDKALSRSPDRGSSRNIARPIEHHNPMECFGSTAVWEDDGRLTIYDKTQGPQNSHNYVCNIFGLAKDKVRVLSPFVGGALRLAASAAISAVPGSAGGHRPEALGQGRAHTAADDPRLRPPPGDDPRP